MQIEFINSKNKFFLDVIALGKKNSATLGFMPDGGFEDHANKNAIIIAHNDAGLCGYLMFREVPRYSRVSIAHLCVNEEFRGQKVTSKLLDALRQKYHSKYSGIALSCREDYATASKVWENYGFVSKGKVRSRSLDEHYLNKWWYDFCKPDLFSLAASNSVKVKALLDVNIIVKLRDTANEYNPSEDPRGLLADWLIDETVFYFSPETYNEINRDEDFNRAERTRGFLSTFIEERCDVEKQKQVAIELKTIIKGNSANDNSDRKQLATCIVSDISYFITFDFGIIGKREIIEAQYDIQIFTPQEFIIVIDQLLNKEEYSPSLLRGVIQHSVSKIKTDELHKCIDSFVDNSSKEKRGTFENIVFSTISKLENTKVKVIKSDTEYLAFYAYTYLQDELIIHFLRLKPRRDKQTLFMQLIADCISKAIKQDISKVTIKEICLADKYKATLSRMGFDEQVDTTTWIKYICNNIISKSDLGVVLENIDIDITGVDFQSADDTQLLNVECRLFPLKIWDIDIPCYIIPIKAFWAGHLFDANISEQTLFGAESDKLWNIENVYYRSTRPITEIAPARILWYVSNDKNISRSKSIVATSYLDEVMTGKPKILYRNNRHYGIYEWQNINELCEGNIEMDIRALKFSKTEVFDCPIRFNNIQQILKYNGRKENSFASPVRVSKEIFNQIYKLGKWGK
mgnify:CR=1 FL=1